MVSSCWICFTDDNPGCFQPCSCKGSLWVHHHCLETYLNKKLEKSLMQNRLDPQDVQCPNCKDQLAFQITQSLRTSWRQCLRIDSNEKASLTLLLLIQLVLVVLDLTGFHQRDSSQQWAAYLHIFTVLIVLGSALFNLIELNACHYQLQLHP